MIDPEHADGASDADAFRRTWNTSDVSQQDRFGYLRESVCQAFFALSLERIDGRDIDARFQKAIVPQGFLSRVDITAHRLVRTRSDVAKLPDDLVAVNLYTFPGYSNQKPAVRSPGHLFVNDFNKIIDVRIGAPQNCLTNLIIKKSFISKYTNIDDLDLTNRPSFGPVAHCMQLIRERYAFASQEELTHLANASISLLVAGLIADHDFLQDECANNNATRTGILQLIEDYTNQNLQDPDLSTVSVATYFGISPRYVQKLFASAGGTFKSYVTNARLDRVRSDLLDSSIAHVPAADIAYRWGFRDITTFHRNFKRRLGDTPRQLRAARLAR